MMTPVFPLFPCRNTNQSVNTFSNCFTFFTATPADVDLGCTDLTVENHDILGVRSQPGLHGFTNSTDLVQGRGVDVRPAIVLHLNRRGGKMIQIQAFKWVKIVSSCKCKAIMFVVYSQMLLCNQSSVWSDIFLRCKFVPLGWVWWCHVSSLIDLGAGIDRDTLENVINLFLQQWSKTYSKKVWHLKGAGDGS